MRSFETSSFTISERNTQDNVHNKIKITLTFIEDKSLISKIDKIRVRKKKKIYFYFLVYKFLLVNIKLLLIK